MSEYPLKYFFSGNFNIRDQIAVGMASRKKFHGEEQGNYKPSAHPNCRWLKGSVGLFFDHSGKHLWTAEALRNLMLRKHSSPQAKNTSIIQEFMKANFEPMILAKTLRIFLPLLLAVSPYAYAQESDAEEFKPKIRGAIMMANSHVPNATEGGKKIAIIPTWGFDFDYYFHPRWSVALQGDVKLQSFEVEDQDVTLERTNPFALAAVIHYHALRHWSFYVGPGIELESHKDFFLMKAGTEYGFEITENFEIALNLIYENKDGVYDAWTFGIAFNKKLWEKK